MQRVMGHQDREYRYSYGRGAGSNDRVAEVDARDALAAETEVDSMGESAFFFPE